MRVALLLLCVGGLCLRGLGLPILIGVLLRRRGLLLRLGLMGGEVHLRYGAIGALGRKIARARRSRSL